MESADWRTSRDRRDTRVAITRRRPGVLTVIVERRNACAAARTIFRAGAVEMKRTYAFDGAACVPLSTMPASVQRLEKEMSDLEQMLVLTAAAGNTG